MTILYILAAILMLGVMVTVHECGHFLGARATGIPVKEFAIGFGPRLLSWKSKKYETRFFLRLIPAGGYCMFYGEDEISGVQADDPRNLGNHKVWKRFLTIAMGPLMNFVLALVVACGIFVILGEDTDGQVGRSFITVVDAGSPADQAGLLPNDSFVSVNGQNAAGLSDDGQLMITSLLGAYQAGDDPLNIVVSRQGESVSVQVTPLYDQARGRYMIGVGLDYEYTPGYTPVSPGRALYLGTHYCVETGGAIIRALGTMLTTGEGFKDSSGPIGTIQIIAEETQRSAQQGGGTAWVTYATLLVMISVNLGLFNLIPIPGLDGSRLVFLLIEAIRRKPTPQKVEAYVHMTGYMMLLGLMLVLTYKDILRIFQ